MQADVEERKQLVETREREREVALQVLSLAASPIHRLGIADGAVADPEQLLTDRLVEVLRQGAPSPHALGSTVLVTPWRHDLHPDHEAVGRAAARPAKSAPTSHQQISRS